MLSSNLQKKLYDIYFFIVLDFLQKILFSHRVILVLTYLQALSAIIIVNCILCSKIIYLYE